MDRLKKPLGILATLGLMAGVLWWARFTPGQILATTIFLGVICGTLFYWQFRIAFAFGGIALLLATRLLDIPHIIEFAGLDIILFLVGMMMLVGLLEERKFFEYLVARVVDTIGERPYHLMAALMALSTLSAALVDEVTSILFMLSAMFHLTKRYKVDPIPFLLMIVFATNVGSSATAVGNPIGVMIAMRAHLTFADFLRWASPGALLAMVATIALSFVWFRQPINELGRKMKADRGTLHEAEKVHVKPDDILLCSWLFGLTIVGLVLHAQLEQLLGLEKNTLLLGISLLAGSIVALLHRHEARDFFSRRVDWWTLTFFMALFASVGTLKYVGVTERIAEAMLVLASGDPMALLIAVTLAISLLTAFMDNVLAVATFIPILAEIQASGVFIFPFWWGILFGGTLFGNATVIGSTANIVAMGMLEREYRQSVSFFTWLGPGLVVSAVTLALALGLVIFQIPLMPH